jgi:hypothetical protein
MRVRAEGYGAVDLDFTDQPPPSGIRLDPARRIAVRHGSSPAAAAKPVRRGSPPESTRKRPARPRARAEESNDQSRDDGAMSDNPDPWAPDAAVREGEGGGSE